MSPPAWGMAVAASSLEASLLSGHRPLSPGSRLGGNSPVAVPPAPRKSEFLPCAWLKLRAGKHVGIGDGEWVGALPWARCWLQLNVVLLVRCEVQDFGPATACACIFSVYLPLDGLLWLGVEVCGHAGSAHAGCTVHAAAPAITTYLQVQGRGQAGARLLPLCLGSWCKPGWADSSPGTHCQLQTHLSAWGSAGRTVENRQDLVSVPEGAAQQGGDALPFCHAPQGRLWITPLLRV